MVPFLGYSPDIDPQTPGCITDVDNMIPTTRGMKGCPSPMDAGYAAFDSAVRGLAVVKVIDGSKRIFAGTSTKLYELSGGAAIDVSRVGDYLLGAESRWSITQFGNDTIAASKETTLQRSNTTGDFADISGAPKARFVASAAGFVMAADTNDSTFGDQADRWWSCAYQDVTDWTPSVATQSVSGRLIESPGPIRALKALGDSFVAYKERAIFLGSYVGGDAVWQWQSIPGDYGVMSNDAVVSTGYNHFFLGPDDFYVFDGTRAVPIGSPIRETFLRDLSGTYRYKTIGGYDRVNALVWWFYCSRSSTGDLDRAVVFNLKSQKWSKLDIHVEAAFEYLVGGLTYESIGTEYATYDDLPTDLSYDSPVWTADAPVFAYVDTTHTLQTLSGQSSSSSLITGNIGDDELMSTVTSIRPRFTTAPNSSTLDYQTDYEYGDSFTEQGSSDLIDGRYDLLSTSRWHRFVFNFSGDVEIIGFNPRVVAAGQR